MKVKVELTDGKLVDLEVGVDIPVAVRSIRLLSISAGEVTDRDTLVLTLEPYPT